jgi:hypothetical protein
LVYETLHSPIRAIRDSLLDARIVRVETALIEKQQQISAVEPARMESGWCLTVEHGLYALVLVGAAVLRLVNLGLIPLSPAEAHEALAAWRLWQPAVLSAGLPAIPESAAYFSLTSLLLPILGSSDAVVRLVPAIFGLALVLLPWGLRPVIGAGGALVTSLLLAVSPVQAIAARTAGGDAIAVFAGLLLLVAWLRYQQEGRYRWFLTAVAAVALGLASAPLFYGLLLTLALAWLGQAYLGPALFEDEEGLPQPTRWPEARRRRQAAFWGAAVLVAVSTMVFWYAPGLAATARLPAAWLTTFTWPSDLMSWIAPVLALGRYELPVIALGTAAVVWATWRGEPFPNFLVFWLTGALFLTLLQQGQMGNVLMLTLPGYLLVGWLAGAILGERGGWEKWLLLVGLLLVGAVVALNLAMHGRITLYQPEQPPLTHVWLAILALALGGIFINLVAMRDGRAALQGALAAVLVCLLVYGWGTAWRLGHQSANDPRERWVGAATDDGVRLLAAALRDFSWRFTRSDRDLAIFAAVDEPALRWYLRDYPHLQVGHTLPHAPDQHVLITRRGDDLLPAGAYVSTSFPLARQETEHLLTATQSLRWWFFYESPVVIPREWVTVWLRADLVGGED